MSMTALLPSNGSYSDSKLKPKILSPRETEIVQLWAYGYENKDIATKLGRSIKTIDAHSHNILRKMHIHTRACVVAVCMRQGLIK